MYPMFPMVRSQISVSFQRRTSFMSKTMGSFTNLPSVPRRGWCSSMLPLTALSGSLSLPGLLVSSNRASALCVAFSPITQIRAAEESRADEQVQQALASLSRGHVRSCACVR